MLKKIFGILTILLLFVSVVFVPQVKAQEGKWYAPSYDEFTKKVFGAPDSQIFGERYTMAQVFWIIHSLPHVLTGNDVGVCISDSDPLGCIEGLVQTGSLNGPIFALASLGDIALSTRPASGVQYIADTAANLHIIPQANAQGVGFNSLSPTLMLWKVTRNFAYGLLTLVVIVFAFMIMFRVKVSPQAVITIQSAIPRVAVAIILITFSYAIAGLLVDLAYVVLGVVSLMAEPITDHSVIEVFSRLVGPATNNLTYFIVLYIIIAIVGVVGGSAIAVALPFVGVVFGTAALILSIIGLVVLFVVLFKIIWLIIKSYVSVIMLVIVSPFLILFGAIQPQGGYSLWVKSILSNLVVIPIVSILVFIANFFAFAGISNVDTVAWDWINPFGFKTQLIEGSIQFPGGFNQEFGQLIGIIIGFGIIVMIPAIANAIKNMIQAPGRLESGIGQALGPGTTLGLGYLRYAAGQAQAGETPHPFRWGVGARNVVRGRLGEEGEGAKHGSRALENLAGAVDRTLNRGR